MTELARDAASALLGPLAVLADALACLLHDAAPTIAGRTR